MWGRGGQSRGGSEEHKIAARVTKLSVDDLVAWGDQAIYSAGRNLTAYLRTSELHYLDEAELGAQVVNHVIRELRRRS